ncbi:MAG: type III toxin-antitoxin system ToxN/AbiQ family toxin, partial [Pseudoleptotrichia goodfellowii]|nr:type III toxin-antitoxin system ToxN/AbiQ family toxin [Pseudoleptotrichia goodfellowii]
MKIDEKYIEYLSRYENKVAQKKNRIWIGVLLEINNIKYFAPLSS